MIAKASRTDLPLERPTDESRAEPSEHMSDPAATLLKDAETPSQKETRAEVANRQTRERATQAEADATELELVARANRRDYASAQGWGDARSARAFSVLKLREPDLAKSASSNAHNFASKHARAGGAQSWTEQLIRKMKMQGRGADKEQILFIPPHLANVVIVLGQHPDWDGVVGYNEFAERIDYLKPAPWHDADRPTIWKAGAQQDADVSRTIAWFQRTDLEVPGAVAGRLNVSQRVIEQAIPVVAEARAFHPVRTYLRSLVWDGIERLPDVLATHFATASTPYTKAIGVRWFISAVARVMLPGCQVDCVLLLESKVQGWRKTSAFRALVPDPSWYADTGVDLRDKDSLQNLHGVWLYGLDELDSTRKAEVTRVKNFLSQDRDHYRPSYGRRARDFPRQNVFCGTTNEERYLPDRTGNRRFWPARLLRPIDVEKIAADRNQLWAEALVRYERGERWHVDTPELRRLCEAEQEERAMFDPWQPLVAEWLADPHVKLDERGEEHPMGHGRRAYDASKGVLTSDVLVYALEKRKGDLTKADEMRVAGILTDLGFTRTRCRENGARAYRYRKSPPGDDSDAEGGDGLNASESRSEQPSSPPTPPNFTHTQWSGSGRPPQGQASDVAVDGGRLPDLASQTSIRSGDGEAKPQETFADYLQREER